MKKQIKWILCTLIMMMNLSLVRADMLPTPQHDDFYQSHQDEIQNGSNFYIQAERDIAVVDYPGSSNVIGVVEEGRVLHLMYYYEDEHGDYWGMQVLGDDVCAWFKLNHVSEFYWSFMFCLDHQSEFERPENKKIFFEEDGWLVLWECPGSDRIAGTLPASDSRDEQFTLQAGYAYVDENGTRWVSISFKGQYGWMNTEEPLSEEKPEVISAYLELDDHFDPSNYDFSESIFETYRNEIMIGTLVIIVCVFTGVMTAFRRKRA